MPADNDWMLPNMQRQRREAATNALQKIQRIREWEEMSENSKRFRECAAAIEAEFRSEERQKHVVPEDIPSDGVDESSDEYESANESFVSCASEEVSECEYEPADDETARDEEDSMTEATESDVPLPSDGDSDVASDMETDASQAETRPDVSVADSVLSVASTVVAPDFHP